MFMLCLIAAIIATFLIVPLITTEHVPPFTLLPTDTIEFEYTQRSIVATPNTPRQEMTLESRVLEIDNSGHTTLYVGYSSDAVESRGNADDDSLHRLRALVKETGFIEIIPVTFLPDEQPATYELYTLRVTLNDEQKSVRWSSDETEENFIPPIIVMIQNELDGIRSTLE